MTSWSGLLWCSVTQPVTVAAVGWMQISSYSSKLDEAYMLLLSLRLCTALQPDLAAKHRTNIRCMQPWISCLHGRLP